MNFGIYVNKYFEANSHTNNFFCTQRQTRNLSKNIQDSIFRQKNFTNGKHVNRDYFCQQ